MELATQVAWYQHFRDRLANKFRVREEKGLHLYEFNGRLTFVSRSPMLVICSTRMTRVAKPPSHCWKPLSRSFDRQSRTWGLIPCSDGIVWNPAISRNHVDVQRAQRVPQFVGKTPMVATSITSRSVIRSESSSTMFQRTHGCRCSSTQCNFSQSSAVVGNHLEISTRSDQCFHGSAGDAWRRHFRQHGRFEESVRRHRRFWHGEFQLGHLVYWTSSTIKRVVRSTLAAEAYSVSEAVEEAQWLRSVLAKIWPSVPSSLPRSLRLIVTLSDSFNLCQAVKSDKGTGSDKRLRIVTAMLREVFFRAQGATLAFVTTATMLADAFTKALVHCPSLLAAMNARRHVFVTYDSSTGVKTLKMAIGSQLIRSAESHSGRSGPCTD